ncbi:MAG TPA: DUF748 domain-containing protein, partial [Aquabacterium sp.]|nr:DUF748 domain-containing protein [Aquabacterium sp.]
MKVNWTKGRIAAMSMAGLVLVTAGVSYVRAPEWIRRAAVGQLEQALGRRVTLDAVDLQWLHLKAAVRGLTIYEADGRQPFVNISKIETQLSWASLRHLAPVVDAFEISAPTVRLARLDATHWNYSDIVARFASRPSEPSTGEPARFSINNIALRQGQLTWDDKLSGTRHTVGDLQITLPFISNLPYVAEQFTTPQISAQVDGSPFRLSGRSRPFAPTRDADLRIELNNLSLVSYLPLLPLQWGAQLEKAGLSTHLTLTFRQDPAKGSSLHLKGQAALSDVAVVDHEGDSLLQWRSLSVQLADSEPLQNRWSVNKVIWDGPVVWLERQRDGRLALLQALE